MVEMKQAKCPWNFTRFVCPGGNAGISCLTVMRPKRAKGTLLPRLTIDIGFIREL